MLFVAISTMQWHLQHVNVTLEKGNELQHPPPDLLLQCCHPEIEGLVPLSVNYPLNSDNKQERD